MEWYDLRLYMMSTKAENGAEATYSSHYELQPAAISLL